MRLLARSLPLLLVSGFALGCGDQTSGLTSSTLPVGSSSAKPAPFVVGLDVSPNGSAVAQGKDFSFAAFKVLSDSSRLPTPAMWISANPAVIAVEGASGHAIAVGVGTTTVAASAGGQAAVATVTVLPAPMMDSAADLIVENFSFIEFEVTPGHWLYAPQMRAHASRGRRVSIANFQFSIPDLGNIPGFVCAAILTDTPQELFGEVYGDWLLEIGGSRRATGNQASASVSFVDDGGVVRTRVLSGPIVAGGWPTTYTGGSNGGACFHGYGSGG